MNFHFCICLNSIYTTTFLYNNYLLICIYDNLHICKTFIYVQIFYIICATFVYAHIFHICRTSIYVHISNFLIFYICAFPISHISHICATFIYEHIFHMCGTFVYTHIWKFHTYERYVHIGKMCIYGSSSCTQLCAYMEDICIYKSCTYMEVVHIWKLQI